MLLGRLPDGVGHGGGDDDGSSAFHQASLLHPLFQEPLVPVELAAPRAKFSVFQGVSISEYGLFLYGLLGCASAFRERFFGKYSIRSEPCFGSRNIGQLAGSCCKI